MRRSFSLVLLGLGLSGCVPETFLDAPGYDLTVVDARTNKPISGAAVAVNSQDQAKQLVSASSDVNGRVQTKSVTHRVWVPMMLDLMGPSVRLTVSADGYNSKDIDGVAPPLVWHGCRSGQNCHYDPAADVEVATIALDPK